MYIHNYRYLLLSIQEEGLYRNVHSLDEILTFPYFLITPYPLTVMETSTGQGYIIKINYSSTIPSLVLSMNEKTAFLS